uniref:Calciumbinding atopy-related autoantigen 1 n=1 Tax=Hirondellea gigas TaxID=1518452 RepID=A0A6A7FXH6_9CRUS
MRKRFTLKQAMLKRLSVKLFKPIEFHKRSLCLSFTDDSRWRARWAGVSGLLVLATGLASSHRQASAESENKPESLGWREKIKGNYENRIRDLSTPEKIFSTFASVHKDGDDVWVKYMTIPDFVHSVLPFDFRKVSEKECQDSETIPKFFQLVDLDKDGLISQAEYVLFSTLLAIPLDHIDVAFRMFDLDGNGEVDLPEFYNLIEVMRPDSLTGYSFKTATRGANVLQSFFGKDQKGTLNIERFRTFISGLRDAMLNLEFQRYEDEESGMMSARNFGMTIIGYCSHTNIPTYIQRLESMEISGQISKQEFFEFNNVLPQLDRVGLILKLYSESKKVISKSDFQRAVWAVTRVIMSRTQVDVIFHIFDVNGDGNLEQDELLGALRQRYEHNQSRHRDVGFTRVLKCCASCFTRDRNN